MPGAIDRRRFLRLGGVTVATAAVLARGDAWAATGGTPRRRGDITMLRTASSLEVLAVDLYAELLAARAVGTNGLAGTLRFLRDHHREHAALFLGITREMGGRPFDGANTVVMDALEPRIDAVETTRDVVQLGYEVENVLAQTYQSFVGQFTDTSLNQTAMAVGGVEASHAVLFTTALDVASVPNAFQPTEDAVERGTGV